MANLQGAQYLLTQPAKGEYAAKIKMTAIFLLAFYKTPLFDKNVRRQQFWSNSLAELLMVNVLYALMRFH